MDVLALFSSTVLLATAFGSTLTATRWYEGFATRCGIVAHPNFRTLHEKPTPRGGGIVFALICLCTVGILALRGIIAPELGLALLAGGAGATAVGFLDDVRNLSAATKLAAQGVLAIAALLSADFRPLFHVAGVPLPVELVLSWFALVWLMNVYNFIDGIDGMAASNAIFLSAAAILVLALGAGPDLAIPLLFAVIAASTLAFLIRNRPPARVFMGDSGSLFLGYVFGVLIARTVTNGQITIWVWLIVLGYLLGDTTTTTLVRIFIVKRWYGAHRSHAYQNLARIWRSHSRVVLLVVIFNVSWLLPLAVLATLVPPTAPLAAALALLPVVLLTLRYGPRESSS
jgi:Fuc2NAc and GlcNAc transferase